MDKKNIIIVVLIIICCILGYMAYDTPEPVSFDSKLLKRLEDSLNNQNTALLKRIDEEQAKSTSFKRRYDSLSQLPEKIKIQYVSIYKNIDKAGSGAIVNGFDSIFTNNGIK